MSLKISLLGQRFGRWMVIGQAKERRHGQLVFFCRCDCGTERDVVSAQLRSGMSSSCGCLRIELGRIRGASSKRHGEASGRGTIEYRTWAAMLCRCRNPSHVAYADYGGRGIAVCERWLSFENFLADMGRRPSEYHSLDRIDNMRGYEPGNCRWATSQEQNRNQRPRGSGRKAMSKRRQ